MVVVVVVVVVVVMVLGSSPTALMLVIFEEALLGHKPLHTLHIVLRVNMGAENRKLVERKSTNPKFHRLGVARNKGTL